MHLDHKVWMLKNLKSESLNQDKSKICKLTINVLLDKFDCINDMPTVL